MICVAASSMADAPESRGEVHIARGKLAASMGERGNHGTSWGGLAAGTEEVELRSDPELTGLVLAPVLVRSKKKKKGP